MQEHTIQNRNTINKSTTFKREDICLSHKYVVSLDVDATFWLHTANLLQAMRAADFVT